MDVFSVVMAAVDVVMPSATAKRITVRTSLDPETPRVLGDQDRLQQVIWNLLSNALKFTPPDGTIHVRLEAASKSARIIVSDTGQGIAREFLPYVFERFRQDDSSSSRRHGGLGLGLALVRELVELHGGTVTAGSEGHNKGATFTIELPAVASPGRHNHLETAVRAPGDVPSLAGVRVLLVEDESDARDLILTALERCGAQVTAVPSTAEAIATIVAASPDSRPAVLVSDIGMPTQDGYELIRRVRSLGPAHGGQIAAIAVTGYATPEDVERALGAGYHVHVAKPMDPSALVSAIAGQVRPASADQSSG